MDYLNIKPDIECFLDEVVLTHAKKKVDSYIRKHNWFGDHLELDLHMIKSEESISQWKKDAKRKGFKTKKVYLVPSPKNFEWTFESAEEDEDKWIPLLKKDDTKKFNLRPIAHVGLRDQTLAMSMLICLANIIETVQGRTDLDVNLARKNNVSSYGNRLYCEWLNDSTGKYFANFKWGNNQIYRKYFEDYKLFLERPKVVCKDLVGKGQEAENLYIISFDLEKFYDNINPKLLSKKIINILKAEGENIHPEFIIKLEEILVWDYEINKESDLFTEDEKKYKIGLPQGLAASGFFANAYMIDFDQRIKKACEIEGYKVVDYIRYVDDMRFVINLNKDNEDIKKVCENLGKIINNLLQELNPYEDNYEIKVNTDKSDYMSYKKISIKSAMSNTMNLLQRSLSGTPDLETLESTLIGLNNLIDISDINKDNKIESVLGISKLIEENTEVRGDTVKRFAASRIYSGLKQKYKIVEISQFDSSNRSAYIKNVNNEIEIYAKKLISYWVYNPSLFLLLKFGLDLYPDPTLARTIVEVLNTKLKSKYNDLSMEKKLEYKVAEFIATDLFINTAKFIGFDDQQDGQQIAEFREVILNFAEEVVNKKDSSWYIIQAATLCLITFGRNHFSILQKNKILQKQQLFLQCARYESELNGDIETRFALGIIVQQISPNRIRYVNWLTNIMQKLDKKEFNKLVDLIVQNDVSLISDILQTQEIKNEDFVGVLKQNKIKMKNIRLINGDEAFLLRDIIVQKNHAFKQENAILLLVNRILLDQKIMRKLEAGEIGINNLTVSCQNWHEINNPFKVDSNFIKLGVEDESRVNYPYWVEEENKWSYTLGMIIRTCITGNIDYTGSVMNEVKYNRYRGINNTQYTRSLGINNFRKNLNNIEYPITPDMLNILFATLRYPGLKLNGKADEIIRNSSNFLKEISRIIGKAQEVYGKLTKIPGYIYSVKNLRNYSKKTLKIVSVQTLMPNYDDIKYSNPNLNSDEYKRKHRNHLAGVCNLITKYLKVHMCEGENDEPFVDLIIFPELAVRYEDIDLLKNLSDNTKASIFTGLTYIQAPNEKLLNQGLWIIREETLSGRNFVEIFQGKQYPTASENGMEVIGHKPYQVFIEFELEHVNAKVAGAICYDATNLALAADLRDSSDLFVVAAYNKDISTFDNMVASLNYHMYQPVILVNCGQFGGSTTQAPYAEHHKMISNTHGGNQIGISICEIDPSQFMDVAKKQSRLKVKTAPAGFRGRSKFKK